MLSVERNDVSPMCMSQNGALDFLIKNMPTLNLYWVFIIFNWCYSIMLLKFLEKRAIKFRIDVLIWVFLGVDPSLISNTVTHVSQDQQRTHWTVKSSVAGMANLSWNRKSRTNSVDLIMLMGYETSCCVVAIVFESGDMQIVNKFEGRFRHRLRRRPMTARISSKT